MIRDLLNRGREGFDETVSGVRDTGSSVGSTVGDAGASVSDFGSRFVERGQEVAPDQHESIEEQDSRWGRFDERIARNTDFLLDNERLSLQQGMRNALTTSYDLGGQTGATLQGEEYDEDPISDEELAQRFQAADEGITEAIDESIEGTRFDNTGTDYLRSGTDMFITEGGRNLFGGFTGIDTREGDTDFRTGAFELGDIALTLGTAGLGRAGVAAARGSDNLFDLSRFGRGADDVSGSAGRQVDDAVPTRQADDAVPTSQADDVVPTSQADEVLPTPASQLDESTSFIRQADEVMPSTSPSPSPPPSGSVRFGDDLFNINPGRTGRFGDDVINIGPARTGRAADDVAGAAGRSADDVAGAASRSLADRIGDALSRFGSGTRRAGSRARSGAGRFGRSRTGRLAAIGGGAGAGLVTAGAVVDEARDRFGFGDFDPDDIDPDDIEPPEDEYMLQNEDGSVTYLYHRDEFEENDRFEYGDLFSVVTETEDGDRDVEGYTVVVGHYFQNVLMLDPDGNMQFAPISRDEFGQRVRDTTPAGTGPSDQVTFTR